MTYYDRWNDRNREAEREGRQHGERGYGYDWDLKTEYFSERGAAYRAGVHEGERVRERREEERQREEEAAERRAYEAAREYQKQDEEAYYEEQQYEQQLAEEPPTEEGPESSEQPTPP